jgi:hypothetical protein
MPLRIRKGWCLRICICHWIVIVIYSGSVRGGIFFLRRGHSQRIELGFRRERDRKRFISSAFEWFIMHFTSRPDPSWHKLWWDSHHGIPIMRLPGDSHGNFSQKDSLRWGMSVMGQSVNDELSLFSQERLVIFTGENDFVMVLEPQISRWFSKGIHAKCAIRWYIEIQRPHFDLMLSIYILGNLQQHYDGSWIGRKFIDVRHDSKTKWPNLHPGVPCALCWWCGSVVCFAPVFHAVRFHFIRADVVTSIPELVGLIGCLRNLNSIVKLLFWEPFILHYTSSRSFQCNAQGAK